MSGNPESTIRNPKSEGSAECAGASGPGNQMIADFGMWIADSRRRTMQGIRISSHSGMNLKSALRNLQFAIVSGAMLFALCVQFEACQVGNENLSSAEKMQKC